MVYNNKATAPLVAYISPGGSEGAVEQHSGQGPLVADKHDKATGTIHRWYFAWGFKCAVEHILSIRRRQLALPFIIIRRQPSDLCYPRISRH